MNQSCGQWVCINLCAKISANHHISVCGCRNALLYANVWYILNDFGNEYLPNDLRISVYLRYTDDRTRFSEADASSWDESTHHDVIHRP